MLPMTATQVKLAVYRHFAETGHRPTPAQVAERAGGSVGDVLAASLEPPPSPACIGICLVR